MTKRRAKIKDTAPASQIVKIKATDGVSNFAAALGTGTNNLLAQTTYTFDFVTRNRIMLEAMYRTSWIIGAGIDVVADDMTQAGCDLKGPMKPDKLEELYEYMDDLKVWDSINSTIKWARLYGTGLGVLLIDGQDMSTPLRIDTVGKGQFKGILPTDRWQWTPSLGQLIKDFGASMGLPEWYQMNPDAILPDLGKVHHTRIIRLDGLELPHYQKQTENLWAESVIERVHDRLMAFDSTTVGAAQLVYKAYLRIWKVKGLRDLMGTASQKMQNALLNNVEFMRRFQSNEGISLVDSEDDFETSTYSFSGLDSVLLQFGQQLSGAWEIPMVRLFGQSPAGLNSTGESDLRTYYDGIRKKQVRMLKTPTKIVAALCSRSLWGKELPKGTTVAFRPLWQLTENDKAEIATKDATAITSAFDSGLLTQKAALLELRQSSQVTGRFSNISDEDIELADDKFPVPETENPDEDGNAEDSAKGDAE